MGKKQKIKEEEVEEKVADADNIEPKELSYEQKLRAVCAIAKPMASKKFTKKLYKLVKKGSKIKNLRYGLKDVQSKLKKGERGIVVLAGDITPIEVMCHVPIVCEELQVPYVFTPSRQDLGTAMGIRRGILMVLVRQHEDYKELFDECVSEVNSLEINSV